MITQNISEPVRLLSTRVWRTYKGGLFLDSLAGNPEPQDSNFPEEWLMSMVSARNSGRSYAMHEGLSMAEGLDEKISLKELIARSPAACLGEKHLKKHGMQIGVLVKLIDTAERLTIQVHPDRNTAKQFFQSSFGKTECWHIIGGRKINGQNPYIYLGFKQGITKARWKELFECQDYEGMLACLHRFEVNKGETFLIRGGVPHAIGEGCLLIEIQEPTDYTIRVERITPAGQSVSDFMCHQGLGFDKMLDIFNYNGQSREEVYHSSYISPVCLPEQSNSKKTRIINYDDTPYFKMNFLEVTNNLKIDGNESFYGLYCISGHGKLFDNQKKEWSIKAGDSFFIPASAGEIVFKCQKNEPIKMFQYRGPR